MSQSLGSISSKRRKKPTPITILIDTREQFPLDFSATEGVTAETGTVWPGDYTVKGGWEKSIAFERKSVGDLIGTMKEGYVGKDSIRRYESRFDLELEEFERHFDRAYIVIEPDKPDVIRKCGGDPEGCDAATQIENHWYVSAIEPYKVIGFIRSLRNTYGVQVVLCRDREESAEFIAETAREYLRARRHVIHREKIRKAEAKISEESPF